MSEETDKISKQMSESIAKTIEMGKAMLGKTIEFGAAMSAKRDAFPFPFPPRQASIVADPAEVFALRTLVMCLTAILISQRQQSDGGSTQSLIKTIEKTCTDSITGSDATQEIKERSAEALRNILSISKTTVIIN